MTRYDRTRTMADGVEDIEAFGFGINRNPPSDGE